MIGPTEPALDRSVEARSDSKQDPETKPRTGVGNMQYLELGA
jgi:hypothetical protein